MNLKPFALPVQTLSLVYIRLAKLTGYWAPRTLPIFFSTMSTTTASLNDILPSNFPKFYANGLNWAVFSLRFEDAVQEKGFWGHFDGTSSRPTADTPSTPTADELAAIEKWEKDEHSSRSLLTQNCQIPL